MDWQAVEMAAELVELTVGGTLAWRESLDCHHGQSAGVWLVLAKKLQLDRRTASQEN
jgi:hypothetical protein